MPERHLRVIVADDNPVDRETVQKLVTGLGHQVVLAESGRQLMEYCRAWPPDLVLVAVNLRDVDTLAAIETVYDRKAVPVILVSGRPEPDLVGHPTRGPVLACLVKPVKEDELANAITAALRRFDDQQATIFGRGCAGLLAAAPRMLGLSPPGTNSLGDWLLVLALFFLLGISTPIGPRSNDVFTVALGLLVIGIDWLSRLVYYRTSLWDRKQGARALFMPMWVMGVVWVIIGLVPLVGLGR